MLIAMQSVAAIADSYHFHQSEQQHENHEHVHGSDMLDEQLTLDSSTVLSNLAQSDCHHCCSSHVMAHLSFAVTHVAISHFGHQTSVFYDGYRSQLLFPDTRPPIV